MARHLPPPPRPGHTRGFTPPHAPDVVVLTDDGWRKGVLVSLQTDLRGAVSATVTYEEDSGAVVRTTVPGHEVREVEALPSPHLGPRPVTAPRLNPA